MERFHKYFFSRNAMIEDDLKRKKNKEAEKAKEKETRTRKSPKPNRRSLDADRVAAAQRHPSPKHEPKKMTAHGKKGWSSKQNIKIDDVPKYNTYLIKGLSLQI